MAETGCNETSLIIAGFPVSYGADRVRKYPAKNERTPTSVARLVFVKNVETVKANKTTPKYPSSQKKNIASHEALGYRRHEQIVEKIPATKKKM
mmetsp:Transcript_18674/g.28334  ORF Transcript_18674/g.28334 Transcript_18674/m.28334 type:complete len:94 (+) Transcript_18674:3794-4075(+)